MAWAAGIFSAVGRFEAEKVRVEELNSRCKKGWECFSSQPFGFNLAGQYVIDFLASATGGAVGGQE